MYFITLIIIVINSTSLSFYMVVFDFVLIFFLIGGRRRGNGEGDCKVENETLTNKVKVHVVNYQSTELIIFPVVFDFVAV